VPAGVSLTPLLAPFGPGRSAETHRDTFYGEVGPIAPYGFLVPGPVVVVGLAHRATGLSLGSLGGAGMQLDHNAWSPHQGEHSDFFRNTFEALHGIAT
jgi:hypothetical protein